MMTISRNLLLYSDSSDNIIYIHISVYIECTTVVCMYIYSVCLLCVFVCVCMCICMCCAVMCCAVLLDL